MKSDLENWLAFTTVMAALFFLFFLVFRTATCAERIYAPERINKIIEEKKLERLNK